MYCTSFPLSPYRPFFRARVSVRARARELKKERVAQPPIYTIVGSDQAVCVCVLRLRKASVTFEAALNI